MQVKWVAAPPKPRDLTTLQIQGLWVDYATLAKCAYRLME